MGDAGVGKTRLVQELSARASAAGWLAIRVAASDEHPAPTLLPWRRVVATLSEQLPDDENGSSGIAHALQPLALAQPSTGHAGKNRPDDLTDPGSYLARLYDAVWQLMRRTAKITPLLIVFDDMHWADLPTVELLDYVLRQLDSERLLLVAAQRERESDICRVLAAMRRPTEIGRVDLRGLDLHETSQLLTAVADEPPTAAAVAEAFERTG